MLRQETRMRSLRTGPASGTREVHARLLDFGLRRAQRLEVHDLCKGTSERVSVALDLYATVKRNANNPLNHAQELLLQETCVMLIEPWSTIFHSSGVMNLLMKKIRRRRMFAAPFSF